MTGKEYQKTILSICSIPYENREDMLRHAVFGLASEAGEVAGLMQKEYQGHEFDVIHFMRELGDCLYMIVEACEAMGMTLEDVMDINIRKLRNRFPNGFDPERSIHRAADDI